MVKSALKEEFQESMFCCVFSFEVEQTETGSHYVTQIDL